MKTRLLPLLLAAAVTAACDDEIHWEDASEGTPAEAAADGMYILCEGLFNMNNSSLSYYDFATGAMASFQDPDKAGSDRTSYDYFKMQNGRRLGDTANDLQRYGSKLWCAVNVSSQVEVMDLATGRSLARIPLFDDSGIARQPRTFAFHGGKAYVCCFDGTVARIDTAALAVDGLAQAGRNPDGICAAAGKLYVSNSGGLDPNEPDNTVSVIDIATFAETRRITVRENPGAIHADADGNVYLVTRGRYDEALADYDCRLHRIDSQTDEVAADYGLPAIDFCISGHRAYLYAYAEGGGGGITVIDTRTGEAIDPSFVKDGTAFVHIYGLAVNPASGDLYVCDAMNYTVNGLVHCFGADGRRKFTLDAKGINPNSIVFAPRHNAGQEGGDPGAAPANGIGQVFSYRPAPGQFVNQMPLYAEGDDAQAMARKCLEAMQAGGLVSLGGFGGSITMGFLRPVANGEGADFRVLGNAYDGSAEPGIVFVAKDENGNGLPDDPWHELAGSEHANPQADRDYAVTYRRPASAAEPVPWADNRGAQGEIPRTVHAQSYYPLWEEDGEMTLSGTRLPSNGAYDPASAMWVMSAYAYGYADNQPNTSAASALDIGWAVNDDGTPACLDTIHFVRVMTAVNQQIPGLVGELSTEVAGLEALQ